MNVQPVLARDALCPHTIRVDAEWRLSDVLDKVEQIRATHAVVFEQDHFHGVVLLQAILHRAPQRIFADLVLRPPPPSTPGDAPIERVGGMLETSRVDAVNVTGPGGDHLGLVTGNSLLRALLAASQRHVQTVERLKEHQERLSTLGLMTGGIVHDLNNSLTPLLGQLELLRLFDYVLPRAGRERLASALTAAGDAVGVIRRLQDFARRNDAPVEHIPLDPSALLSEVRELTRPKWRTEAERSGKRIEMEIESEPVPLVAGVAGQLREVLTNLIFNAVDAIGHTGRILLRAREQGGQVLLEVGDTGAGMSEAVRARCFDRFFTTKGETGTGLGLPVSAELVRAHGGHLEVDTAPEQGSTFRLVLPPCKESEAKTPTAPDLPPRRRVLCIDDDPKLLDTIRDLLDHLGQEVETARGGAAGLARIHSGSYDVVITDLSMDPPGGRDIIQAVRRALPGTHVVLLTGWPRSAILSELPATLQPDQLLSKPIGLDDLQRALNTLPGA